MVEILLHRNADVNAEVKDKFYTLDHFPCYPGCVDLIIVIYDIYFKLMVKTKPMNS